MAERKNEIEIVREAAEKLGCEPEELLNTVRKFKREILEMEEEIKKLK